jgi:Phage portal protein
VSRFAQARAEGSYTSGAFGARPVTPAELVAAQSSWSGGSRSAAGGGPQPPALLYDADGKELGFESFRSPFDGGPGFPIQPRLTDSARPPREFQYTPGWNLIPTPRGEGGMLRFAALRALAAVCWQFRVAVNYRKKQVRGTRWDFGPKDAKTPGAKKEFQEDIDRVNAFFRAPNRIDRTGFGEWIGQMVEEMLIVDAVPFFKHPSKDGSLYALVQIDGATIKQIIDEFGHVIGYQQILYGYPATQYPTYDPTTKTAVIRDADELNGRLDYVVTNPTVSNVYGTSTLEQLGPIIDIAIRRTAKQLSWYQDGTVPESLIEAPEGYTPEQIMQLQKMFNEEFSGNDRLRSSMTLLPHGANYTPTKPFAFSKDESEEIISIICASEGIPRSIFTSQTNRATAEMQRDDAQDTGLRPIMLTIKDALDRWIQNDLGAPDLEATPVERTAGNEWEGAQRKALMVTSGLRTVDEMRAEDGLDPLPEEDRPEAKAARMAAIMAASAKPGEEKPGGKPPFAPKPSADDAAQKSELGAWERFARKRLEKGKQTAAFDTSALSEDVSNLVMLGLAAAGTDAQVRAVFSDARGAIEKKKLTAAKRKNFERELYGAVKRSFDDQKASLLRRAKNDLPAEAAA